MWVDTHAHLYQEVFLEDQSQVIDRMTRAKVKKSILPNIDLASIPRMHQLADDYPQIFYPAYGLHPCSVESDFRDQLQNIRLELEKNLYRAVAIGETGLDLYWEPSKFDIQKEALKIQLEWCVEFNLPVILHARNALDPLIEIVEPYKNQVKGVFHCFSGTIAQIRAIAEMGFYFGIGGVLTFKNSGLDKVLSEIPRAQLIFETDAPYLAPHPYRGKRNESAYIPVIAKKAADILSCSMEELADESTQNACRLFNNLI